MNVKKFFSILLIILLVALAAFAGVVAAWLNSPPFEVGEHGDALAQVGADGIVNILVVGKDHVGANTDVIMVASLNAKANKISILSIPRDTRVQFHGQRKINSVYSYAQQKGMKKEEALINVVSQTSGLPIHYYAVINLRAFRDVVNALGGVEFNIERPYHYDDPLQDLHIHIDPGYQVLDGEKAEGLIRYRADYVEGDIKRVQVQQAFLTAMVQQKLQLKYISKIPEIYEKVTENVVGNLTVNDLVNFAKAATSCGTQTFTLPGYYAGDGSGSWIRDDAETERLIRENFGYTDEN